MFYVTNTHSTIDLTNVALTLSNEVLLKVAGNSSNNWGTPGSNGGHITFTATTQKLTGDSYITSFSGTFENVDTNGFELYIDGVLQQ